MLYEIGRRLVSRGHVVTVLTQRRQASLPVGEIIAGVRVHRYPVRQDSRLARNVSVMSNCAKAIRRLRRQARLDLLVGFHTTPTFGALLWGGLADIPYVYVFHAPNYLEYALYARFQALAVTGLQRLTRLALIPAVALVRKQMESLCLRRADRIHVLSEFTRDIVCQAFHVPENKTFLVPGGVDLRRFVLGRDRAEARARLGLPLACTLFVTVRRLEPRMGLDNLLEAMARVALVHPQAYLVIVGQGSLRPYLEEIVHRLELEERVRFAGFVPDESLLDYYHAADYFVLPTVALEGFGMATVEALATGTPVLGTPVGATREILSSLNPDWLFPDESPQAMAAAMARVAAQPPDMATRIQCRQFVQEHYDWDHQVERLEQEYLALVTRKGEAQ